MVLSYPFSLAVFAQGHNELTITYAVMNSTEDNQTHMDFADHFAPKGLPSDAT